MDRIDLASMGTRSRRPWSRELGRFAALGAALIAFAVPAYAAAPADAPAIPTPLVDHHIHLGSDELGRQMDVMHKRDSKSFELVACLLDPAKVRTLVEEQDRPSREPLRPHLLSEDDALATLVGLLVAEGESSGASGRLYGDSLALAIMSRFVANAQRLPLVPAATATHPLPAAKLRHVVDLITSDLSGDLSLDVLARESGYSRAHFLRMFRAATGSTPHRYLTDRRLEFARHQLTAGSATITEIAHAAGFASHSHLTKLFRARYGTPPGEYRRST